MEEKHTAPEVVFLTRANGCPNCNAVKTVLSTLSIHYETIDVDTESLKAAPYLNNATSRSLPLMFIKGENVAAGLACIPEVRKYAN